MCVCVCVCIPIQACVCVSVCVLRAVLFHILATVPGQAVMGLAHMPHIASGPESGVESGPACRWVHTVGVPPTTPLLRGRLIFVAWTSSLMIVSFHPTAMRRTCITLGV